MVGRKEVLDVDFKTKVKAFFFPSFNISVLVPYKLKTFLTFQLPIFQNHLFNIFKGKNIAVHPI